MKKLNLNFKPFFKALFIVMIGVLLSKNAVAQTDLMNDNLAVYNNIKLGFEVPGKFNLDYERAMNSYSSAIIGFTAYTISKNKDLPDRPFTKFPNIGIGTTTDSYLTKKSEAEGYLFTAQYRVYLLRAGKIFNGLYLGPHVFWGKHKLTYFGSKGYTNISASEKLTTQGFGLKIGYQKRWKMFNLELGVNLSKSKVVEDIEGIRLNDETFIKFDKDVEGQTAKFYFGVGFAF